MRMESHRPHRQREAAAFVVALLLIAGLAIVLAPSASLAQDTNGQTRFDIYGFAMLDMGYQTKQNDPAWFDVIRPTKLPAYKDQFGKDGRWFSGVRQSRFGVKSWTQTSLGELNTIFEFDLFGVGADAGQTTIRPRHFWGELGHFGAGQTNSPFMDVDVFPNCLDYWGPNGMLFFRNVQFRWMPVQGDTRVWLALERPGASGDGGDYSVFPEVSSGLTGRFPAPDFSAQCRIGKPWGYVQVAGIVRYIKWDDVITDQYDLSGDAVGWGVDLSSNLKMKQDVLRLQFVYGEGIQNYFNDATVDVGAAPNPGNAVTPIKGETIPVTAFTVFYDKQWNDKWTSTAGYSYLNMDNTEGQSADAFKKGQYAVANLLFYPVSNVMLGPELQWVKRDNFKDGFTSDDFRIQFSAKYNFSYKLGGS
jgi:hypothetical protein